MAAFPFHDKVWHSRLMMIIHMGMELKIYKHHKDCPFSGEGQPQLGSCQTSTPPTRTQRSTMREKRQRVLPRKQWPLPSLLLLRPLATLGNLEVST